jgi:hypothetical protein
MRAKAPTTKSAPHHGRKRSVRLSSVVLALLAVSSLTACGGADEDGERVADQSATSTSPQDTSTATSDSRDDEPSGGTRIRVRVGGTTLSARLHNNATARDMADQLPQTLTFRDHNNAEKTGRLPNQLSTEGAPEGHDPSAGDIGYFSPGGDLVFYYDAAAPYFDGIVRIGEVDGNVDAIRQQDGDVRITIERAD